MNYHKPIPHSLSRYGSGTEVLYKCAKCGTDFRILGKYEAFCHGCGNEQDWSDSPQYCSEIFKKRYDDLVYKRYAFIRGKRKVDKELMELMWQFYKGIFR